MEKLKETIFQIANSNPNVSSLSPSQIALIQHQFLLAFPVLHTPTHPTYASMIQSAIKGLNEEDGSNEESISEYIKANFDGLPWAHNAYLSHHLSKLCKNGEIVCYSSSTSKFYTTPALAIFKDNNSRRELAKQNLCRERNEPVIQVEEGIAGGEEVVEVSNNLIEVEGDAVLMSGRTNVNPRRQSTFVDEDDEVGGTLAAVGEQNIGNISSSQIMMDMNDDTATSDAELMLVPDECVQKSSLSLFSPSVSDVRGDAAELAVEESGLKESELVIVPYEGNTLISSERMNPVIVCGLAQGQLPTPKQKKHHPKRKSKASQDKIEASVVSTPSLPAIPKHKKRKHPLKKKLKASQENIEVYTESMLSHPALAVGQNLLDHDPEHELLSHRGLETKASGTESETAPSWLMPMLKGQYFVSCSLHANLTKKENNMFCLDCMGDAFCPNCLSLHNEDHRVIQIRRSSYHNVVRVNEIQRYLDISGVHTFVINGAKIVFLNTRPQSTFGKGSHTCEICYRSLLDSSRFCSLGCKHYATMMETAKFKESQEACTSSMLSDGIRDQLEKQKNLVPLHLDSHEEPMPVEDDEDLPLRTVLKKCGKRKKDAVQRPTAKSSLVTEESFEQQTNLIVEEKASMLFQYDKNESHENHEVPNPTSNTSLGIEASSEPATSLIVEETTSLLSQIMIESREEFDRQTVHPEFEPSGVPAIGHMTLDILQSEQKEHHEQPITAPASLEQSVPNLVQQIKGQEQSQNYVQLLDLEAPVATFEEENMPPIIEKYKQDINQLSEFQGSPQKQLENSKEDTIASPNEHFQQQEKPFEILKQLKRDGQKRPKKDKGDTGVVDSLNLQSQQRNKQQKLGNRGRPKKQLEETKDDATAVSNSLLQQQEELSEAALIKQPKKGRGRPRKQTKVIEEDKQASFNLYLNSKEGSCEFENGQHSLQQIETIKKGDQGMPFQIEGTKEDAEGSLNLNIHRQDGLSKMASNMRSQQQINELKKRSRGRPRKQIATTERASPDLLNLPLQQQAGSSEPEPQQNSLLQVRIRKKDGRGRPRKQKELTKNDPVASMNLQLQENSQLNMEGQGKPMEQDLTDSFKLPHKLEEELSDQEKEVGDCIDVETEKLQNECHNTSVTGHEMPILGDGVHQSLKKQKLEGDSQLPEASALTTPSDNQPDHQLEEQDCPENEEIQSQLPEARALTTPSDNQPDHELEEQDCLENEEIQSQLPEARALTTPSDNQPDHQLEEQDCLENEEIQIKFDAQSKPPKEKPSKATAIQVPLSSKDQLRSRVRRQCADST